MKVATIVGARPQFVKAAPVSEALRCAGLSEVLIHTGQHYDANLSRVFFDEMAIRRPDVNLGVGSGRHGQQTGRMLALVEDVLIAQDPDWVIVFGDTNSTLAGALAACKLSIPLAHVEAGLRSYRRSMPEEHNRVLTDHCSDLLLCPTVTAVDNLAAEGITRGVALVGDPMYDAVLRFRDAALARPTVADRLGLEPGRFVLLTVHRPYNTDRPRELASIVRALSEIDAEVVFPAHPRTRTKLADLAADGPDVRTLDNVHVIDPVGYLDMLGLESQARVVLTDSGGVQKEAFFFAVPCVTLRPETEWVETVESGWNVLVGSDTHAIVRAVAEARRPGARPPSPYGDGDASKRIVEALLAGPPDRSL